jgi:hypothetical protein
MRSFPQREEKELYTCQAILLLLAENGHLLALLINRSRAATGNVVVGLACDACPWDTCANRSIQLESASITRFYSNEPEGHPNFLPS